ncbi:MAG: ABC transporter permease [Firmicutes bacterium]|nr:ABC transporter permease [Bacillota bacterium]
MIDEMYSMGIGSIIIVMIVSVAMGSVITLQTSLQQAESTWIPAWTIGFTVRTSVILELCPTIISLLLVGNLGSRITAEIGSMRVTEQIDALEVMGINSASYLALPKIIASFFVNPALIIISIFFALIGGYFTILATGFISTYDYIDGITSYFVMYDVWYALTKTVVFGFVISSIAAFYGYKIEGGALELGKANTEGVVVASFIILILNLLITNIMLN